MADYFGGRFRNVMITMLLGGLWHGAAWTFVAWGAFHGLIITASHQLSKITAFARFQQPSSRWISLFEWAATFYLVLVGWVLFRAPSLGSAFDMLADMHGVGGALPSAGVKAGTILLLTMSTLLLMHLMDRFVLTRSEWLERKPWLFWTLLIVIQALCLLIEEPSNEFIYFQF